MSAALEVSSSGLSPAPSLDEEEESQILSCARSAVPAGTMGSLAISPSALDSSITASVPKPSASVPKPSAERSITNSENVPAIPPVLEAPTKRPRKSAPKKDPQPRKMALSK